MTVKIYSRRDSCTSVLRKMGVDKKDYDFFIDAQGGQFVCRTDKAERHLSQLKEQAASPKLDDKSKATKKVLDKVAKEPRVTVSGTARQLIRDGKTNEEVWAVIQPLFKLDDGKKHYPAWYRAEMIRSGQIK